MEMIIMKCCKYGAMRVRDLLDEVFPNRWSGRAGPISWLPRSLDLTPLEFFLWGFIKDRVYALSLN
ncbi:hypothetical protein C0J52_17983 [Blattella germanica]|nr:hypothetical protein C0J52_17983 [Blattella germanica]